MKNATKIGIFLLCFLLISGEAANMAFATSGRAKRAKRSRKFQKRAKRSRRLSLHHRKHRRYRNRRLRRKKIVQKRKPFRAGLIAQQMNKEEMKQIPQAVLSLREDRKWPSKSLSQVYRIAKSKNITLKDLKQRLVQADIMRKRAWSVLQPTLSLQASYTRNGDEVKLDPSGGKSIPGLPKSEPIVLTPKEQMNLSLQVNWTLFNAQTIPMLQTSYLSHKQIYKQISRAKKELLYSVARSYYSILLADGLVEISRQKLLNAQKNERISRLRKQLGTQTEIDWMRSRLEVTKAEQSLQNTSIGLKSARLILASLLGRSSFRYRAIKPKALKSPLGSQRELLSLALKMRSDVKVKELAIQVAQKQVTQVYMGFLPTLALTGRVSLSDRAGPSDKKTQWSVGLVANLPIYTGGSRFHSLQEAQSKLRQAKLAYQQSRNDIEQEIKQATLSLQKSKMAVRLAKQQALLAERTYQLQELRYRNGQSSSLALSESLTQKFTGKMNQLREMLQRELSIISLHRSIGRYQLSF